jgi:hypothetical protein
VRQADQGRGIADLRDAATIDEEAGRRPDDRPPVEDPSGPIENRGGQVRRGHKLTS